MQFPNRYGLPGLIFYLSMLHTCAPNKAGKSHTCHLSTKAWYFSGMPCWSDVHFRFLWQYVFPCWSRSEVLQTDSPSRRFPAYCHMHKYIHVPDDCGNCSGSDFRSGFSLFLHPAHRKICYTSRTSVSGFWVTRIKTSGNHPIFFLQYDMFRLPSLRLLLIFPDTYTQLRSDSPAHMHTHLPFRQDGFFLNPRKFQELWEYPSLK